MESPAEYVERTKASQWQALKILGHSISRVEELRQIHETRSSRRSEPARLTCQARPTKMEVRLYFRQLLNDETACASYLFGCKSQGKFAVVDPHVDLVERTGATPYLPAGAGVDFEHEPLSDGDVVRLGNTEIEAISTPGHAVAHHAYLITDHARADDPWMVLTGDALLVGDAGRPDLHAHGDLTPVSTIGFERRHNSALQFSTEEGFVEALTREIPPAPEDQAAIVAANRSGRPMVGAS
jgi:hypothetical protein